MGAVSSRASTPVSSRESNPAWMQGSAAVLRGAVLGVLLERPGHPYELSNRLMKRLASWQIDRKNIYRQLETLAEEGLAYGVEGTRSENDGRPLTVYHPTAETAGAMTAWMDKLLPRKPTRLDLQAKLAVAREEDLPRVLAALREYERECLQLARIVAPRPSSSEAPCLAAVFIDCSRDSVREELEQQIAWAKRSRKRINEYVASHQ
jgi:DNA-binding PadR family transcriptional regulator